MAILSIFIGIVLALKNQPSINTTANYEQYVVLDEQQADQKDDPEQPEETTQLTSAEDQKQAADKTSTNHVNTEANEEVSEDEKNSELTAEDNSATSYDDLLAEDDEVEGQEGEISKVENKENEEKLPQEAEKVLNDILDVADEALRIQDQFSYTVGRGDKLKDVLEQSGLGASDARAMIKRFPELANLDGGQQFYWILDNHGELEYMNWLVSEKEERIYERKDNGKWVFQKIEKKGEWRQDVVRGVISGSFSSSLKEVGLSERQVNQLAVGLQSQIATNKLKKGDRFAILVKREYINGTVTEVGNVEGILIVSGKKRYYAIQADNGRYYSSHGETLSRGFARIPLLFNARVSSHYNPRRLHPVTRRVRPHNGVDFGIPTGTPIIAPSDGVVEHIAYQAKGAGRYIKIRHGHITTVYMHLSKTLVRVGQSVKKGERIALSGNTGASTGPHLHYEFHLNGRPVNPMTVKLPGSNSGMADKERKKFLTRAKYVEAKLKF
ncbi:murein DD-endopeptidase MepM [Actinobacillus pleuropneumoniae]|uniref:Murein DD-endopeptidase MepM n=1 Tax=Actinobacillus pleuropneumoniae TaxID=715 RepID=A0ABM6X1W9_ACTPL|nr:murein DD-endopeptidase MepM [Actinobacillus pleuropneumoniae]AWG94875.1 murein DD-endopeptidase MepM [Actinobacillus pleuropneumoniae serovar 1 str. 4074]AXA20948.1 murein DD-endopeptidase MepM [Actinobacillus pleuropneumoniae]EFM94744.1 M23B subfamily peptidase [Actinobacillus pleuropneumoniae serovar 9 str. CVJ13261]EFM98914.1 M23B subfamily peptidase [Actinobacillus pleuropneumoniae serovar 11 str. 56153]MBL4535099.1 murein DD-endopeptidase MepM [Actinobacillus pleuropneumoniae]